MTCFGRQLAFGLIGICSLAAVVPASAENTDAQASFADMHAAVERSYQRTKMGVRTANGYLTARGRPIRVANQNHQGMNGILEYYPLTEKDEETGHVSSKIIVTMKAAETLERDSSALAYIRRDSSGYRWTSYSLQYQAGDAAKELPLLAQDSKPGVLRPGKKLTIPLATAHLLAPLRHGSALFVTLHSDTPPALRVTIPFSYLVGYAARASEHGLIGSNEAAMPLRLRAAIKAKSGH